MVDSHSEGYNYIEGYEWPSRPHYSNVTFTNNRFVTYDSPIPILNFPPPETHDDNIRRLALESVEHVTPNLPMLRKVYEQIVCYPEQWNQNSWAVDYDAIRQLSARQAFDLGLTYSTETDLEIAQTQPMCHTAYCFAGHAVYMTPNMRFIWEQDGYGASNCEDTSTGQTTAIPTKAREVLGIDAVFSGELFAPNNTLDDIYFMLSCLFEAAGDSFTA